MVEDVSATHSAMDKVERSVIIGRQSDSVHNICVTRKATSSSAMAERPRKA